MLGPPPKGNAHRFGFQGLVGEVVPKAVHLKDGATLYSVHPNLLVYRGNKRISSLQNPDRLYYLLPYEPPVSKTYIVAWPWSSKEEMVGGRHLEPFHQDT